MGKMERHYLSAIFGDISQEEFGALLSDIEQYGFLYPEIVVYEGKILDGWHRYRIANQLNWVDRLKFVDLPETASPTDYVVSQNLHRRHLTASQRAQIVVEANDWVSNGANRYTLGLSNDEPKTREKMAQEANVSTPTIDRAKQVSNIGRSEEVIKGEKSACAVLAEEKNAADVDIAYEECLDFLSYGGFLPKDFLRANFSKEQLFKIEESVKAYKFDLEEAHFIYGNISDDELNALQQESVALQVPLSREYLKEIALRNNARTRR